MLSVIPAAALGPLRRIKLLQDARDRMDRRIPNRKISTHGLQIRSSKILESVSLTNSTMTKITVLLSFLLCTFADSHIIHMLIVVYVCFTY